MFPLSDGQRSGKLPIITYLIIGINVIVFIIELLAPDFNDFISTYAFVPAYFHFFDLNTWWPLIAAAFMHGGYTHIIFNMLFLWVFGDNVEASLGTLGYILFYLGAAISAALLQYVIDPTTFIPMLGASGAIAGVLGYYLVMFPQHKIKTIIIGQFGRIFTPELPAIFFLGYWVLIQFIDGFGSLVTQDSGGTAWFAHIGGVLFGVAIAFILKQLMISKPYTVIET